ncbi:tRNA dimethylallyltransferase [Thermaurantimonas aggregans]|uniref:tRNA dimethylallyltransferase n=1 Tax=Thermaurantimonas aggregans TaxID=2173829 RepID=A0A401XN07_9FLAO|nr:tRNA (adenosine(37)-N6)-dimethylallyltransferase MiaA [Thermaurantimonas aggregans]MCX8149737.1 tRNA (adenosine(37)-N6)-dimethylallyltransferase MiaA [Thermaurantimonas aggregans]GCD78404.1 tRNA dimethylallyltransferase [Thermaurantimonas aggregans]
MKHLIVIGGPTASGKTKFAIQLAQFFQTEILSYDSRQFYKEIPIATAQPTEQELAQAQHHFIGFRSIHQPLNASDFSDLAEVRLHDIFQKSDFCIAVGGSGLYAKAWLEGFDDVPHVPVEVRNQINSIYEKGGIEALQSLLKEVDPLYYEKVDLSNPRRLTRALEVYYHTGMPFSFYLNKKVKTQKNYRIFYLGLNPDRAELHKAIEWRVGEMVKNGLFEEVEPLHPYKNLQALQTVGCREVFDMLDGKYTRDQCIEQIIIHTRQYARRQITWYNRVHGMHWFSKIPRENEVLEALDLDATGGQRSF